MRRWTVVFRIEHSLSPLALDSVLSRTLKPDGEECNRLSIMKIGLLSSWITDLEGSAVESDPAERETVSSEPPISPSLDNCRRFCVSTHDHRGTL